MNFAKGCYGVSGLAGPTQQDLSWKYGRSGYHSFWIKFVSIHTRCPTIRNDGAIVFNFFGGDNATEGERILGQPAGDGDPLVLVQPDCEPIKVLVRRKEYQLQPFFGGHLRCRDGIPVELESRSSTGEERANTCAPSIRESIAPDLGRVEDALNHPLKFSLEQCIPPSDMRSRQPCRLRKFERGCYRRQFIDRLH